MIDQSEILEAANEPGLNVSGYLVWLFFPDFLFTSLSACKSSSSQPISSWRCFHDAGWQRDV